MIRTVLFAFALALCGAAAFAHTSLVRSFPEDGAEVPGLDRLELEFSEAVNPRFTRLELTGPDGRTVSAEIGAGEDGALTATPAAPLKPGAWTAAWRTTSNDGHTVEGEFRFEITTR